MDAKQLVCKSVFQNGAPSPEQFTEIWAALIRQTEMFGTTPFAGR